MTATALCHHRCRFCMAYAGISSARFSRISRCRDCACRAARGALLVRCCLLYAPAFRDSNVSACIGASRSWRHGGWRVFGTHPRHLARWRACSPAAQRRRHRHKRQRICVAAALACLASHRWIGASRTSAYRKSASLSATAASQHQGASAVSAAMGSSERRRLNRYVWIFALNACLRHRTYRGSALFCALRAGRAYRSRRARRRRRIAASG